MNDPTAIDPVLLEILWSRLTAIVSEQATSIISTSFSPLVRDAGDLATAVFDIQGRMIAHGVTGTAGHIVPMSRTLEHFLSIFPPSALEDGDVLINNDPWTGSGHLFDVTIATPVFHESQLVGFVASTSHQLDIGGLGYGSRGTDIFEEGLFIPPLKFARRGVYDDAVCAFIRANVREPDIVLGDLRALAAANEVAGESVRRMLTSYRLPDLQEVAEEIFRRSEAAAREAVRNLADGTYSAETMLDGDGHPVKVAVTLTVSGDTIVADYTGSSPQVRRGINVTPSYTAGFTVFALWCALGRGIPNNHGSLKPFSVTAPRGTIVSAEYPAPVSARHVVGQMVPGLVLLALSKAAPENVISEGAGAIWAFGVQGTNAERRPYVRTFILSGGMGARPHADGLSTTQYPTGTRGTPIEITEAVSPLRYRRKELRVDSGGAGRFRGGLGQTVEVEFLPRDGEGPCTVFLMGDRSMFSSSGLEGGKEGGNGTLHTSDVGAHSVARLWTTVEKPLTVIMNTPGAGGYGRPEERQLEEVQRDLDYGLVTVAAAEEHYGVVVLPDGTIDRQASELKRRTMLTRTNEKPTSAAVGTRYA
jgi:N-methylhydantoinase B